MEVRFSTTFYHFLPLPTTLETRMTLDRWCGGWVDGWFTYLTNGGIYSSLYRNKLGLGNTLRLPFLSGLVSLSYGYPYIKDTDGYYNVYHVI